MDYSDLKSVVELTSNGKNTVLLDCRGKPSIMVKLPKQTYRSLGIADSNKTHPAWIVNREEKDYLYIGKYEASVEDGLAYSLPGKEPASAVTFEEAIAYCEAKGDGWHLITNAEFAAIALWCKANGYLPGGNSDHGCNHAHPHERGVSEVDMPKQILTGSGPDSWSHDRSSSGIFDLSGNVWEWCGGLRLDDGEIQIIPNNDAAAHADMSISSSEWKAILPNGDLVDPGTEGTLKMNREVIGDNTEQEKIVGGSVIDTVLDKPNYTGADKTVRYGIAINYSFDDISGKEGLALPDLFQALLIAPLGSGNEGGFYLRNYGERPILRGGAYMEGPGSGIFAASMDGVRTLRADFIGFRIAYVD